MMYQAGRRLSNRYRQASKRSAFFMGWDEWEAGGDFSIPARSLPKVVRKAYRDGWGNRSRYEWGKLLARQVAEREAFRRVTRYLPQRLDGRSPSATYERLLSMQKGKCAICRGDNEGKRFSLDHCHASGRIRGLLCQRCNVGLGFFLDSPRLLRKASRYLEP